MPYDRSPRLQAIVLAGGRGVRLSPLTATLPKPLIPLGETPVMELVLRRLAAAGIVEIAVATGHLGHLIEACFGDGSGFGARLTYFRESSPLGTAGAIGVLLDRTDEDFIVANGDLLTTLEIAELVAAHRSTGAGATIGVYEMKWAADYGLIEVDRHMRLTAYREKPVETHLVSMGVYVLAREAVRGLIAPGTALDMPDLMLRMRDAGRPVLCHRAEGYWLDIGRPEDLKRARRDFAADPRRFLATG
jgi:NDP-sugar pyrophosphorylase family protein